MNQPPEVAFTMLAVHNGDAVPEGSSWSSHASMAFGRPVQDSAGASTKCTLGEDRDRSEEVVTEKPHKKEKEKNLKFL